MNQKDRKRVKEWVTEWQKILYLNDWIIHIVYPENDEQCVGRTEATVRYYEATIELFPKFFKKDLETQWRCVAHEMTHIVLAPFQNILQRQSQGTIIGFDEYKDCLEQTTTRISNIFLKSWEYKK